MFYIGPQRQQTPALFPRKILKPVNHPSLVFKFWNSESRPFTNPGFEDLVSNGFGLFEIRPIIRQIQKPKLLLYSWTCGWVTLNYTVQQIIWTSILKGIFVPKGNEELDGLVKTWSARSNMENEPRWSEKFITEKKNSLISSDSLINLIIMFELIQTSPL